MVTSFPLTTILSQFTFDAFALDSRLKLTLTSPHCPVILMGTPGLTTR